MKSLSRRSRVLIEALETRRLLTLVVSSPFADGTVAEGSAPTVVPLTGHFDNSAITGTVVEMQVLTGGNGPTGNIFIELTDSATPLTVANFLQYVNGSLYNNTFIHRVQVAANDGIGIVQGGGYLDTSNIPHVVTFGTFTGNASDTLTFTPTDTTNGSITRSSGDFIADGFAAGQFVTITGSTSNNFHAQIASLTSTVLTLTQTDAPMASETDSDSSAVSILAGVQNEFDPSRPNVAGTIAMAKTSYANSATSEWFFNTVDNPALDNTSNSGGFTTFGNVVSGMNLVTAIDALPQPNPPLSSPFGNLPIAPNANPASVSLADVVLLTGVKVVSKISGFSGVSSNTSLVTVVGSGTTLTLNYVPGAVGTSTITVGAQDVLGNTIQTTFNVTVMGPDIAIANGATPISDSQLTPVSFGSAELNAVLQQTFTISNNGNQTLNLGATSLPTGYSFVQAPPSSIAFGHSADVIVGVATDTPGIKSGTITIGSDDQDTPIFHIPVTAQVAVPDIAVALGATQLTSGQIAPVDFGSTAPGTTSHVTLTLTNVGAGPLNLGAVTVPAGFSIVQAAQSPVAVGTPTSLILAMDTTNPGVRSGLLSIASDDPDEPSFDLILSGTVVFSVPLGTGGVTSINYTDGDGTKVTLTLTGGGSATVSFNGTGLASSTSKKNTTVTGTGLSVDQISLTGTTAKSKLIVTAHGGTNGLADVNTITADAKLDTISGTTLRLDNGLNVPGLRMLQLNTANNAALVVGAADGALTFNLTKAIDTSLSAAGSIKLLNAGQWTDSVSTHPIAAASISTLTVLGGNFSPNLTVTGGLANASIHGTLAGGTWNVGSLANLNVSGAISATTIHATGAIGHVAVHGAISGSHIASGGNITSVQAASLTGSTIYAATVPASGLLPGSLADFTASATIASVNFRNFSNSAIAAKFLTNLNLGTITTNNSGTADGVGADAIKSLTATTDAKKKVHLVKLTTASNIAALTANLNLQDFTIKLV